MIEIVPDFSTPLNTDGHGEYLLNARYDWIRTFPALGWGIINIVTEGGITQLHVPESTARMVHEHSRIPLVELDWITDTDHNKYIEAQANNLDDSWLAD